MRTENKHKGASKDKLFRIFLKYKMYFERSTNQKSTGKMDRNTTQLQVRHYLFNQNSQRISVYYKD